MRSLATAALFLLAAACLPVAHAQLINEELAARNHINLRRAQIGLSPLGHSAQLTTAARGHADWLIRNNQVGHYEDPQLTDGFYGAHFQDRLSTAGYMPLLSGSEVISFGPASGVEAVDALLQAIYHRFGIFKTNIDEQGLAFGANHPSFGNVLVANFASRSTPLPAPPASWMGTYPFDGQTGIPVDFYSNTEAPDPWDGGDRIGYALSVHVRDGQTLVVQSFTLTPAAGEALPAIALSGTGSTPDAHTPVSVAALLPLVRLAYATTYTAAFTGTVDGTPVARTWSFTTAPSAIRLAPATVSVEPGASVALKVSGGGSVYTASWSYFGASSPISAQFLGAETLLLTGVSAGSATLTVTGADGDSVDVPLTVAFGVDTLPDAFSFPPRTGAAPGSVVTSHAVTITGLNAPVAVSVQGGEYAINEGLYSGLPGTLMPGDRLNIRLAAPTTYGATRAAVVDAGGVQSVFQTTTIALGEQTLEPVLTTGWHMLGAALSHPLDPIDAFGHADLRLPGVSDKVESVWRWNAVTQKWQFYSPWITLAQNAQHAAAMGYEVLTTILPGQGFWVKAAEAVTLPAMSGTPLAGGASVFGSLPRAWSQLSSGAEQAPQEFNAELAPPVNTGEVPINFESLWQWEPTLKNWLFYSPRLEALPGGLANVTQYTVEHGLLDFQTTGHTLMPGTGIWIYRR